jgi:hypothetical protein
MPKAKKKAAARSAQKTAAYSTPSLAPQILEQAAQGWLQSSGATLPAPRATPAQGDHRLAEVLMETFRELRAEISELRSRLDRLEIR